jgi:hypothetical protein
MIFGGCFDLGKIFRSFAKRDRMDTIGQDLRKYKKYTLING